MTTRLRQNTAISTAAHSPHDAPTKTALKTWETREKPRQREAVAGERFLTFYPIASLIANPLITLPRGKGLHVVPAKLSI